MTDTVERARKLAQETDSENDYCDGVHDRLLLEMANEIERLESEIERLRKEVEYLREDRHVGH